MAANPRAARLTSANLHCLARQLGIKIFWLRARRNRRGDPRLHGQFLTPEDGPARRRALAWDWKDQLTSWCLGPRTLDRILRDLLFFEWPVIILWRGLQGKERELSLAHELGHAIAWQAYGKSFHYRGRLLSPTLLRARRRLAGYRYSGDPFTGRPELVAEVIGRRLLGMALPPPLLRLADRALTAGICAPGRTVEEWLTIYANAKRMSDGT